MLFYLLFSILYFLIIFSAGIIGHSIFKRFAGIDTKFSFIEIFFLGFIVSSITCSFLSIVVPLNEYVTIGFVLVCTAGIAAFRKELISQLSKARSLSKIDLFVIFTIIFTTISSSIYGGFVYDTGLYHTQAIKWISQYPVVSGLGNLHGRFAFNSLFFPLSSTFSLNGSFLGKGVLIYPLNTIVFIVFIIWEYFLLKRSLRNKNVNGSIFIIAIVSLSVYLLRGSVSSPSPDVVCAVLVIYIFQSIVSNEWRNENTKTLLTIGLVFLCISFKLSTVLLLPITLLFLDRKAAMRNSIAIGFWGIVILTPFFVRNYYLSGYLIYPFPEIDIFTVDWKIPIKSVIAEKAWIGSWAKIPGKHYGEVLDLALIEWLPTWFLKKSFVTRSMLIVSFCLPFIAVLAPWRERWKTQKVAIIMSANLVFWFLQAPDPRFAYGFISIASAYTLYCTLVALQHKWLRTGMLTFASIYLSIITITNLNFYGKKLISNYSYPRQLAFPMNYRNATKTTEINSSFIYFKPETGDRCFNSKIPCTPYPNALLTLRGDNIGDGFRISDDQVE